MEAFERLSLSLSFSLSFSLSLSLSLSLSFFSLSLSPPLSLSFLLFLSPLLSVTMSQTQHNTSQNLGIFFNIFQLFFCPFHKRQEARSAWSSAGILWQTQAPKLLSDHFCKHFQKSKHLLRSEVSWCDQTCVDLQLHRSTTCSASRTSTPKKPFPRSEFTQRYIWTYSHVTGYWSITKCRFFTKFSKSFDHGKTKKEMVKK